jgi:hypothetical protein
MYLTRNTVYALPPKRTRRPKTKATPILTSRIIRHRPKPAAPEPHPEVGRAALDRMWREMVEAVARLASPSGLRHKHARSGE